MEPDIYWLVFETNPGAHVRNRGSYRKLALTCTKHGLPAPVVLGAGEEWAGFSRKWKAVLTYCKRLPKDAIVMVTDARDVLCNRNHGRLVTAFNRVSKDGEKVVFGSEVGCCVDPMREYPPGAFLSKQGGRKLRKAENSARWYAHGGDGGDGDVDDMWYSWFRRQRPKGCTTSSFALNAGLGVATARAWTQMIPRLKIKSSWEDDQTLWSSLMYIAPEKITLDYGTKIFTNTNVWDPEGCFMTFDTRRGSWRNKRTRTYSYVIQTPGAPYDQYKDTAWSCYMEMYKKLASR